MKIFNRTSLPETIKYNDRTYHKFSSLSEYVNQSKGMDMRGVKLIQVYVLAGNLKGKKDINGHPYQPTRWVFACFPN